MRFSSYAALGLFAFVTTINAATFVFADDPFAGTNAGDPGRQIVNGAIAPDITLDVANDDLFLNPGTFGVTDISFANNLVASLPATGINFVVVQDTAAMFGAGTAADLIAAQFTDPGPGFFIYFNTGLDLARLIFSQDLSDPSADLSVLARLTNFSGPAGLAALPTITAANVTVPEPSTILMTAAGALMLCCSALRRRRRS